VIFTCHIWNWFRDEKNDFFFVADFPVSRLFMAKKHDLSDKNFSVCHAPLPLLYAKFVPRLQPRQEDL
jgi:hypothetical protein